MNRMTITLDPDLLNRAKEALKAPTKAETVRIALTEVVRKQQLAAALQHRGRIDLDLDQETLRRLRQDS
jgi:Arc/MetJ family transcription regulator